VGVSNIYFGFLKAKTHPNFSDFEERFRLTSENAPHRIILKKTQAHETHRHCKSEVEAETYHRLPQPIGNPTF
jgi:hypothetical protein